MIAEVRNAVQTIDHIAHAPNQPEEILSDKKVAPHSPAEKRPRVKPVGIRRQEVDLKQLFLNRNPILFTASGRLHPPPETLL
jgi:hypothetical protein